MVKRLKATCFIIFQLVTLCLSIANAMPVSQSKNLETAIALFKWNSINLISHADLKEEDISQFFAPNFVVKANGVITKANYANYFKFLNQFRKNIKSIQYEFEPFIKDAHHVVMPLKANIISNDNQTNVFDAILILKFNQDHKIILWHEVYVLLK